MQLALLTIAIFNAIRYPNVYNSKELRFEEVDFSREDFRRRMDLVIPVCHGLMLLLIFLSDNPWKPVERLRSYSAFGGMVIVMVILVLVYNLLLVYPDLLIEVSVDATYNFLVIEGVCITHCILANAFFLLIRGVIKHKVQLTDIPENRQFPDQDTVLAIKNVTNKFTSHYIAVIVVNQMYFSKNWEIRWMKWASILQLLIITILIFVNPKSGPGWWVSKAPKIFYVLLVMDYIVFPISILFAIVFYFSKVAAVYGFENNPGQYFDVYFIFFLILQVGRILEFWAEIRHQIISDMKEYLDTK